MPRKVVVLPSLEVFKRCADVLLLRDNGLVLDLAMLG